MFSRATKGENNRFDYVLMQKKRKFLITINLMSVSLTWNPCIGTTWTLPYLNQILGLFRS